MPRDWPQILVEMDRAFGFGPETTGLAGDGPPRRLTTRGSSYPYDTDAQPSYGQADNASGRANGKHIRGGRPPIPKDLHFSPHDGTDEAEWEFEAAGTPSNIGISGRGAGVGGGVTEPGLSHGWADAPFREKEDEDDPYPVFENSLEDIFAWAHEPERPAGQSMASLNEPESQLVPIDSLMITVAPPKDMQSVAASLDMSCLDSAWGAFELLDRRDPRMFEISA